MTDPARIGLCFRCTHARTVPTPRVEYWRCAYSELDPRYERYPRLPVLECAAFTPMPERAEGGPEPRDGDGPETPGR